MAPRRQQPKQSKALQRHYNATRKQPFYPEYNKGAVDFRKGVADYHRPTSEKPSGKQIGLQPGLWKVAPSGGHNLRAPKIPKQQEREFWRNVGRDPPLDAMRPAQPQHKQPWPRKEIQWGPQYHAYPDRQHGYYGINKNTQYVHPADRNHRHKIVDFQCHKPNPTVPRYTSFGFAPPLSTFS